MFGVCTRTSQCGLSTPSPILSAFCRQKWPVVVCSILVLTPLSGLAFLPVHVMQLAHAQALTMLYRHPENERTPPAKVGSTMLLHRTGVDISTSFSLTFPKIGAMAFCEFTHDMACDRLADRRYCQFAFSYGQIVPYSHRRLKGGDTGTGIHLPT